MPGFSSASDIFDEFLNGKKLISQFRRVTSNAATSAAGRWHEMVTSTGETGASSLAGSAGAGTALTSYSDSLTAGFLIPPYSSTGADDSYFVSSLGLSSPTATVPICTAILCDFLYYYPSCVVTGSPSTLSTTPAVPRQTNGEGVMALVTVQTALGAATPQLTLTYVDHNGDSRTGIVTSPANSAPVSTALTNAGGPFVPMASSARGIRSITSYTIDSGGTTGTVCMFLVRPLVAIPIAAQNIPSETELFMQMPYMPKVQPGACLQYIIMPGGNLVANGILAGKIEYIWG